MATLRAWSKRFLSVSIPTVMALGALAGPAQAAPVLIVSGGNLQGATGVTVGATTYNVEFLDGTCAAVFSGCDALSDFGIADYQQAWDAALALLDQVFTNSAAGNFDDHPELTRGCSDTWGCSAVIPYAFFPGNQISRVAALNYVPVGGPDVVGAGNAVLDPDTSPQGSVTYARFTVAAPVPEPATLTLLGLGCAGLGVARRRRPL